MRLPTPVSPPHGPISAPHASLALFALAAICACGAEPGPDDTSGGPAAGPGTSVEPTSVAGTLHFEDVTSASGLDLVTTSGRTPSTQLLEVKGGGLALLDGDGDGDLDVFVPNGATLDSPTSGPGAKYFANEGDMRFRDATPESGIEFRAWGFGTAVGDVDGDGNDDVFIACYGRNALLRGLGGGRFEDATERAGLAGDRWSTAAAFGDVDGDGDLDLYVVNYVEFDTESLPPGTDFLGAQVFGGPMGLPGSADRLYLNDGNGVFRDASSEAGIESVPPSYGLGVAILDFDSDGRQDIFVGNDSQANFLFHNQGEGRFEDVGPESGIGLDQAGWGQATMGIAIADVNGDAAPDVFTSNFQDDANTLHVGLGSLLFEDRTRLFGLAVVSRPYLGWAAGFYDFDLDRDEDLLVFNGHVYSEEVTAPQGWRHFQEPLLFERRAQRFRRVTPDEGGAWLGEAHCDRSAAFGDLDGDGDVDAIATELNGPVRVLENTGGTGHWLSVALSNPGEGNRRGLGARIELDSGRDRQVRWIYGGGSYQASSAQVAYFGLGDRGAPVTLEVIWPDGETQSLGEVRIDRHLVVERKK